MSNKGNGLSHRMMQYSLPTAVTAARLLSRGSEALGLPNSASGCCTALTHAGISNVLQPGTVPYDERIGSYWSVTSQLTPFCIVQPTSTGEVALALTTLVEKTSCQFAVRSGGHFIWPANNIENGVTIDLGLMVTSTYNATTQVVSIQAGSRWGGVYETLDPLNATVAGGRVASVGVAGFLTGGGNSYYTARKGFACDNVVNFEVVLADGQIANANATNNADLFQVLKGGQSNFGIVTRFDMQAFDVPLLWSGVNLWNKSSTAQHIDAYVNWTKNLRNDPSGSAILFWQYIPELKDIIIIAALEDTEGREKPAAFDEFLAIPDVISSTSRIASHLEVTSEPGPEEGYRDIWFTATIKPDREVVAKIVELHQEVCDFMTAQSSEYYSSQALFQAIPTLFSEHSVRKGGNVLGLDREKEDLIMLLFTMAVESQEQEAVAQAQMRQWGDAVMEFARSRGAAAEWQYINYSYDYQDPLSSYGDENVRKIQQAAAKYDPNGVFQTRAPGGFKVSKRSGYGV